MRFAANKNIIGVAVVIIMYYNYNFSIFLSLLLQHVLWLAVVPVRAVLVPVMRVTQAIHCLMVTVSVQPVQWPTVTRVPAIPVSVRAARLDTH